MCRLEVTRICLGTSKYQPKLTLIIKNINWSPTTNEIHRLGQPESHTPIRHFCAQKYMEKLADIRVNSAVHKLESRVGVTPRLSLNPEEIMLFHPVVNCLM